MFDRALGCLFLLAGLVVLFGELLAFFLFGAVLVRAGFFSDPDVYARWRPWLLAGGLLIGVPMHAAALILTFSGSASMLAGAPHQRGALAVVAVYLTLLTGRAQTHRAKWVQDRLKAVGRLALTNYLSETVICTTIFCSFGFGLDAALGPPETLLVLLGVWAAQPALQSPLLAVLPHRPGRVDLAQPGPTPVRGAPTACADPSASSGS